MSDNPFNTPVEQSPYSTNAPTGPEPIPTPVMVIAIVGLILGLMSALGSCSGAAMMFASEFFVTLVPDEESKAAMKKMMDIQFIPTLVQAAIGMVASLMLVVGAIGCLTRKPWGGGCMRLAMVVSILSSLVWMAMNIWVTLFHADVMSAPNAATMGETQAKQMFYVGQVVGIGIGLVALGFYIYGAIYFGKQKVKDFFDRQADRLRQG